MFSFSEYQGQSSLLHKHGTIEINTTYVTRRKPLWLVALQLLGVAVMVAVGYGLIVPSLLHFDFPLWQAIAVASGAMLIYMGVAFFVRPEPNTDNMGWGIGGLADDPYQYSDDINRNLWSIHCLLGPGRFISETLLDVCVVLKLAGGEEVLDDQAEGAIALAAQDAAATNATPLPTSIGLSPNRFERPTLHDGVPR